LKNRLGLISINLRKAIQRVYWDRERPARNEREARNAFVENNSASSVGGGRDARDLSI
jgi:hypothetical protein